MGFIIVIILIVLNIYLYSKNPIKRNCANCDGKCMK